MFKPPPTYDQEEQDAMQGDMKTVEDADIFMSIGNTAGAGKKLKKGKKSMSSLKDQGRSFSNDASTVTDEDSGDNIMNANWGADVFDIVDDDFVDDDSSDEEEDDVNGGFLAADSKLPGNGGGAPLDAVKEIADAEVSYDSGDDDEDDDDDGDLADGKKQRAAGGGIVSKAGAAASSSMSGSSTSSAPDGDTIGNMQSVVQVSTDDSDSFVDDDTISKGSSMHTGLRFSFEATAVDAYDPARAAMSSAGSTMQTQPSRNEMSSEEQEMRAKKFKSKMTKRSIEQLVKKQNETPSPSSKGNRRGSGVSAGAGGGSNSSSNTPLVASKGRRSSKDISPFASPPRSPDAAAGGGGILGSKKVRLSAIDPSSRMQTPDLSRRGFAGGGGVGGHIASSRMTTPDNARRRSHLLQDDDEDTVELSMEQFGAIMDTLALQALPQYEEESSPVNVSIEPSALYAELRNYLNGTGAGFHQERGNRDSQEDRCLLITDLSTVYTTGQVVDRRGHRVSGRERREFFSTDVDPNKVDLFKRFSMACLFDGHNGSTCSEFLYQHFAQTLTAHPKILDKTPETALLDVFQTLDRMVRDFYGYY
jgi:hypothetical protein